MKKHAYLIMAHNDFYILEKLLRLIDDKRNDIYLHIDKKVKDFDFDKYKKMVKSSNLYFTERLDVRWGTNTQINCELLLLKSATANDHYSYYHLLSGVDLPLKNQDYIHNFFEKNDGKEFVHYHSHKEMGDNKLDRVKYYHCFNSCLRSPSKLKQELSKKFYYNFLRLQRCFKVNRIKNRENKYRHGANWFSITDGLARYIVNQIVKIKKEYKHTFCADEIFLQSIIYNSEFYDKLYLKKDDDYKQNMRFIDWNRGEPYTFVSDDFDLLINSDMLFARKFSTNIDKNIVDMIYKEVK